jgi:hypothetical protein
MIDKKHEIYTKIANEIFDNGERYPKKHGNWMRLKLDNDEYLCMDTWNRAIHLVKNAVYDNQWTGFTGEDVAYLGLDFGGFHSYFNLTYLRSVLKRCKNNEEF